MNNEVLVKEWLTYAKMDYDTAVYLHENMVPEPLEIVCYHCQQFAEKTLKALLLESNLPLSKTHDLGILVSQLGEHQEIPDDVLDACDRLSPYGVKVRYPRELFIEEQHVKQAIADTRFIRQWSEEYCESL